MYIYIWMECSHFPLLENGESVLFLIFYSLISHELLITRTSIKKSTIFWKSIMRSFRWIEINCFNIFRFLAEVSENLQNCTILSNLRTITQERKMEFRQMTVYFSSTFWALTVCDTRFCIWKLPKFIFMGSSFRPFWSAKYLNFGGVSCEIRIFSCSIQKTYTLTKVKKQVFFFFSSWEPNLSDLMVYFRLFQNAILHSIEGKVFKF